MEILVKKPFLYAVVLVLTSVLMGLVSAWGLKSLTLIHDATIPTVLIIVGLVVGVNTARFLLWGYIHKRYPLSLSYPLNSLFFPAILIMSFFYGENVNFYQFLAVLLITLGVATLAYEGEKN